MDWLAEERLVRVADALDAAAMARRAADEVPRAKRLASLLRPLAHEAPREPPSSDDEVVEDFFRIERVEPGVLWLEQDVGPLEVPEAASDIARAGLVDRRRGDAPRRHLAPRRGRQRLSAPRRRVGAGR